MKMAVKAKAQLSPNSWCWCSRDRWQYEFCNL